MAYAQPETALAERLYMRRKAMKLKQSEAAKQVGISMIAYQQAERHGRMGFMVKTKVLAWLERKGARSGKPAVPSAA